ncbi:hypothetical protein BC829DRAFT_268342 [Chytridium lagenaria]|nr:hypothetical protein BC829DRAFT_268342 [Chytridium lagenaria]
MTSAVSHTSTSSAPSSHNTSGQQRPLKSPRSWSRVRRTVIASDGTHSASPSGSSSSQLPSASPPMHIDLSDSMVDRVSMDAFDTNPRISPRKSPHTSAVQSHMSGPSTAWPFPVVANASPPTVSLSHPSPAFHPLTIPSSQTSVNTTMSAQSHTSHASAQSTATIFHSPAQHFTTDTLRSTTSGSSLNEFTTIDADMIQQPSEDRTLGSKASQASIASASGSTGRKGRSSTPPPSSRGNGGRKRLSFLSLAQHPWPKLAKRMLSFGQSHHDTSRREDGRIRLQQPPHSALNPASIAAASQSPSPQVQSPLLQCCILALTCLI